MSNKIGRNEPCPCGSGKKYKQCCGTSAAPVAVPAESEEGGVERALAWLAQYHRKALAAAFKTAIDDAVHQIFDDEVDAREAMAGISEELWGQIQINFTEWLLAEGDIQVKGEQQRLVDLLLGQHGPQLTAGQRDWLEQLAIRPLRLYDVTDVVADASITLCDALDTERPPLVVSERSASRSLRVGMQIGARVMEVAGEHQLSGAVYPFSAWSGRDVQGALRDLETEFAAHDEDDILMFGLEIIESWLAQYLVPPPLPDIVHSATGEPLLFVTDHYAVQDWDALAAGLAAQPDVHGDRDAGWNRLLDGEDGLTRSQATITPESDGRRVAVLYKTSDLAERGRAWFDALAGNSVKFQLQEVSDPKGLLTRADPSALQATAGTTLPEGMDPAAATGIIESYILRHYANWADEPIPALSGQTPRQAARSAAGLERVKGLLRSYADGEARQAAQQGRREISYQFLWDALGLERDAPR